MDSKLDQSAASTFPPRGEERLERRVRADQLRAQCHAPYDSPLASYLVDTMRIDYQLANGNLNPGSNLWKHSVDGSASGGCVQAAGGTSYSQALKTAINELTNHGRPTRRRSSSS